MTRDPRPPLDQVASIGAATQSVVARLEALSSDASLPDLDLAAAPSLVDLSDIFGLDPVSTALVLCVTSCETEPKSAPSMLRLGAANGLSIGLAERLIGPGVRAALADSAPLRRWRMIEVVGNGPLYERVLRIDTRVLDYVLYRPGLDIRLEGLIRPLLGAETIPLTHEAEAARLATALTADGPPPVILVEGGDAEGRCNLIRHAAALAGAQVLRLDAADLPIAWTERYATAIYLDRELALSRALLIIEAEAGLAQSRNLPALIEQMLSAVAVSAPEASLPDREPALRVRLRKPDRGDRRKGWQESLGAEAASVTLDHLATQFALSPQAIRSVAAEINGSDPERIDAALWQAARRRSRGPLDGLAERITSRVGWDDLVVPAVTRAALQDLAAHQRNSWRVLSDWGWTKKGDRGLGTAALFVGLSGTGKTLAAEVIAGELALDLYQIDLSRVVSKYIGETEKNLSRIFEAAEAGGAILLFDEADALFGKRSEVKDSHDRYANVEVSYLLQRMEAYRGLAILTTNQRDAVDRAFLRRLRQVVVFPFPDSAARAEIWAQIFPKETPLDGIDPQRLARLTIAGGSIRSIALNATFLAAAQDAPVRPEHLLRAARREYAKLEKPFTATEAEVFR
ncbi:ATP-binding protein [Ruegeria arenilitoris]|uniref:ATP-binding protein n=1 Tax=Ruegeria arenilitoris TaxID=1173585 RepID=UPI0014804EAB|nr:AAA family ATPase [Ruegeria arenilitoris]